MIKSILILLRESVSKWIPFFLVLLYATSIVKASNYKGAEYRTHESFLYGRFEVSMKPANRVGVISSFFTYHEITSTSDWNEIDVENIGRYDDNIQFNTITPGQQNHVRNEPISFNPYVDFHTYSFEWTPDYIAWFIDGIEVYRQTGEHVQEVNRAQKIMMNIWNPEFENWVGVWNDYSLPVFAYYDWVSYSSYTPGSGNTGTSNNFTEEWTDNFDAFNAARWGMGTHTFPGNKCDFIKENVVFEDGILILCLTDADNLGYQDMAKPTLVYAQAMENGSIKLKFSEELNKISAEVASNYTITQGSVISGKLSDDLTTVLLSTDSFDPTQATNMIVMNIEDLYGNIISPAAKTIIVSEFLEFPIKINVGGNSELGYLATQEWDQSLQYGRMDGDDASWPLNTPILNTDEDVLYLTDVQKVKKYNVKVPNQQYDVTLMFAEKWFNIPGKRIFDLTIEGERIEENLDIFSKVGKNSAYNLTATINVEDELLDIILSPRLDWTTLSGIIIEPKPNSIEFGEGVLDNFELFQNYPNPFNPTTIISYNLSIPTYVSLKVFDVIGNEIQILVDEMQSSGRHKIEFDASQMSSGIYFYRLVTNGSYRSTKKMILIK